MSDPFIAEIKLFAGNFAPRGFAFCEGQLLPIAQNSALFSLVGVFYGGDGRTTFALPDIRGRSPIQPGQGPGLSSNRIGDRGGRENITLTLQNLPVHDHSLSATKVRQPASSEGGNQNSPVGHFPAVTVTGKGSTAARDFAYHDTAGTNEFLADASITGTTDNSGGSEAFDSRSPFIGINYIIALVGIFPSRS